MSEGQLSYARMDVLCPHCGKVSKQLIRQMVDNDGIACLRCKEVIDISSKDWRSKIAETADLFRQIKTIKSG